MATRNTAVGCFLLLFLAFSVARGRPGIRSPPKSLIYDNNGPELKVVSSLAAISERDVKRNPETETVPPTTNPVEDAPNETPPTKISSIGRISMNMRLTQSNGTKMNRNFGSHHMGVAVPLSNEDLEKELNDVDHLKHTPDTSTAKEGISTWILLSGTSPTKAPIKMSHRYESKIDRVPKPVSNDVTTAKLENITTVKPSTQTETQHILHRKNVADTKVDDHIVTDIQLQSNSGAMRRKKPSNEQRPSLVTKKKVQKATTTSTPSAKPTVSISTTTTPSTATTKLKTHQSKTPTSTTITPPTTKVLPSTKIESTTVPSYTATVEVPSTTVETTTFLILEPKEADFDLPQDRSPGPTTKKPKRNSANKTSKTKKNQNKLKTEAAEKKPAKTSVVPNTKDKPITTQIYNYLAREIMPTVGVGLVGLAVTAGLATYFLGPFGGLRRSYDVADRKDDMYFYNNEEYAGADGQSEEEVFGKVIAGMPVNSPYRNTIKYTTAYQPNQIQHAQFRPGPTYPKHGPNGPPPAPYRYRNNAATYQPHMHPMGFNPRPQPQLQPQPQSPPQQVQDPYAQPQHFRYNSDMNGVYRSNAKLVPNAQRSKTDFEEVNQVQTHNMQKFDKIFTPSQEFNPQMMNVQGETDFHPKLDEPTLNENENTEAANNVSDSSILSRRSQFVVGSVTSADQIEQSSAADNTSPAAQVTVGTVPEHGPRRRRKREIFRDDSDANDMENEIFNDPVITVKTSTERIIDVRSTMGPTLNDKESIDGVSEHPTTESQAPTENANEQNVFQMIRKILEIKFLMGLSFLQSTTEAFQRYLKEVERRFEEAKILSVPH